MRQPSSPPFGGQYCSCYSWAATIGPWKTAPVWRTGIYFFVSSSSRQAWLFILALFLGLPFSTCHLVDTLPLIYSPHLWVHLCPRLYYALLTNLAAAILLDLVPFLCGIILTSSTAIHAHTRTNGLGLRKPRLFDVQVSTFLFFWIFIFRILDVSMSLTLYSARVLGLPFPMCHFVDPLPLIYSPHPWVRLWPHVLCFLDELCCHLIRSCTLPLQSRSCLFHGKPCPYQKQCSLLAILLPEIQVSIYWLWVPILSLVSLRLSYRHLS